MALAGAASNGLAMEGSGAQRQTEAAKPLKGRANSELPNVAPAEGGRPLNSELPKGKTSLNCSLEVISQKNVSLLDLAK